MSAAAPEGDHNPFEAGSLFRKWDLHVHTPESIVHNFAGSKEEAWEQWLKDVESLPEDFAVLGINDYIFLDGYRKVLEFRRDGRMSNIALVLPVIELRLAMFAGSGSDLKRLNYHVIFSDELSADDIEAHFLSGLRAKYKTELDGKAWRSTLTPSTLRDLGKSIRDATPAGKRASLGDDLHVGFSNLNLELGDITTALSSSYLHGKYLTAVGKAEWDQLRWDQMAGSKKTILNEVDFVFTAIETKEQYDRALQSLRDNGVNDRLMDCSDAHHHFVSAQKDRIGNCSTWVKADPTFAGLRMARLDFEDRVFVGPLPGVLQRTRENKGRYIGRLKIQKRPESTLGERWFELDIPVNPGLVAVIGSKGSGKSALADVLGLIGSFPNGDMFSFLHRDKFRQPRSNKAEHFIAEVEWLSGRKDEIGLHELVGSGPHPSIRYIPQRFLEEICNELKQKERGKFDEEIEGVIFSHVKQADRLETNSLQELIQKLTAVSDERIRFIRTEISELNQQIAHMERSADPANKLRLDKELQVKQDELNRHDSSKPPSPTEPSKDPNQQKHNKNILGQMQEVRRRQDATQKQLSETQASQTREAKQIAAISKALGRLDNFEQQYESFVNSFADDPDISQFNPRELVRLVKSTDGLLRLQKEASVRKQDLDRKLNPDDATSLPAKIELDKMELLSLQAQLDAPNQKYQEELAAIEKWTAARNKMIGSQAEVGTLTNIKARIAELNEIPSKLEALRQKRQKAVESIFKEIEALVNSYKRLYKPVQDFISSHKLVRDKYGLTFDVNIQESGFMESFFDRVSHGVTGSFCGTEQGEDRLAKMLGLADFQTLEGTTAFLHTLEEGLRRDLRDGFGDETSVEKQLKGSASLEDLYDFIYSLEYLRPRFSLGLDGRPLAELSPGQKGTLLLIFYLLVDNNDIPLVIDQPEDNLDNETVYELLVPALMEAKQRRQVFIVTHNPNLAVVCTAEQIIRAEFQKGNGFLLNYVSGSLENHDMKELGINILEGTRPALENRVAKYYRPDEN